MRAPLPGTRLVELDGCLNFRDLGGYPTRDGRRLRWGRLYRSDALHELSPGDVARLRDDLGLRTVVDLRTSGEVRSDGAARLPSPPVRWHHVPLFEREGDVAVERVPADLGEQYFLLARFGQRAVASAIGLLAASRAPAVFHCAAGKDRTGIVSAVVLGALGVDDEHIVEDYVYTTRNLDGIIERLRRSASYELIVDRLPPDTLHARPETMLSLIERLRARYGSMRDYAIGGGVSPAALEALETQLLES